MVASSSRRVLGDYFTLQRGTTYKGRLLGMPGPVLLGLATIQRNGGFRRNSLQTYGGDSPDKLLVKPGELYLSLKDVTQSADLLGAVARLPRDHLPGRLTQDTVKLEPKAPDVPLDYLYWLLRTPQYRGYCRSHATGTTNLGLARDDFLGFPAPEPSRQQLGIVGTLTALDDKIELNRRMNETLEGMARALFKSWFVDFDPVRAKAEGRDSGLPKSLADLFPARLVDSELGEIPEGWQIGPILDHARLMSGGTPKTDRPEYWDGSIAWASAKDVSQSPGAFLVATVRTITERGLDESATQMVPAFCSVVVARGATTGRMVLFGCDMAMNQTCYALASTTETPFALYCRLRAEIDALVHAAHGSVFDTITTSTFTSSRIVLPPQALLKAFEDRAAPLFLRVLESTRETRTLAALRDALLPKLISGELQVRAAEHFQQAAV
ncbi:MAG: restriction endonuclease subunit S [Casimicrobiaceae bacterium]